METIKRTIQYFGSARKMAKALGIRYDMITKYVHNKRLPGEKLAFNIEEKTNGRITAKEILSEKYKIKYDLDE